MGNYVQLILSHGRIKPEIIEGDAISKSRFYEFEPRGDSFSLEMLPSNSDQNPTIYHIIAGMMTNLSTYNAVPNPTPWGIQGFLCYEHDALMPWFKDENNKVTSCNTHIIGGIEILEQCLLIAVKEIILKLLKNDINVVLRTKDGVAKVIRAQDYNNPPQFEKNIDTLIHYLQPLRNTEQIIDDFKDNIPKEKRQVLIRKYYCPPIEFWRS